MVASHGTVDLTTEDSAARILLNRPEALNAWNEQFGRDLLHAVTTVAAVNGPAVGIGCSLALAADLIVAAESAYFLLAFVNIGLVPDGGSTAFLPARIGYARAAEMAMLGERVPADQAP